MVKPSEPANGDASAIFTPPPHRALQPSTSAVTAPAPPLLTGIAAISATTITGTTQRTASDEAISHTAYQLLRAGRRWRQLDGRAPLLHLPCAA